VSVAAVTTRAVALACALGSLLMGCDPTETVPVTAVVVAIDAEPMVRSMIDEVRVEIASGPDFNSLERRTEERFDISRDTRLPLTLALVPKSSTANVFRVWVRGLRNDQAVSELRALSGFAPQRAVLLELLLTDACIGMLSCEEDETCVATDTATICGDAEIDVVSLLPFDQDEIDRLRDASVPGLDGGEDGGHAVDDAGDLDASTDASDPDGAGPITDSSTPMTDTGVVQDADPPPLPEDCENGDDDDEDGDIDCADSECGPDYICVPDGDELAVMLDDVNDSCPAGYALEETLGSDLQYPRTCSGCACSVAQASGCQAPVYFFSSASECADPGSLGTLVGTATSAPCSGTAIRDGFLSGWRVGDIVPVTPPSCSVHGALEIGTASFANTRKVCRAAEPPAARGGGCDTGFACVPREDSGTQCGLYAPGAECPDPDSLDWYPDFEDRRTCSCNCQVQGGSCDAARVRMGNDWACIDQSNVTENTRVCFGSTGYSPPVWVLDGPTSASCSASSNLGGSVVPVGVGYRICCAP